MLHLLVSIRFQVLFHSPSGVLFTFPSRYYTLSVTRSYLALGDGPPTFTPGFSCPVLLWNTTVVISVSLTRLLLYIAQLSNYVQLLKRTNYMWVLTPFYTSINGLGSYPFARHYLGNRCFTFSSFGYLDVSVPRVPLTTLWIHVVIPILSHGCVPAFGYPRINVYLQLPVAFRSLSRPSSAPDAKASTIRSY